MTASITMRKLVTFGALTLLSVLVTQIGCSRESRLPDFSGNTTGDIFLDYVKGYGNLGELAADSDLIAVGTIDRTIGVVTDEATKNESLKNRSYLTRSAFRVERVVKGKADSEIILSQMGAVGWAEEVGNPVFRPGERLILFLRDGHDGRYYLLHPLGRYPIKDNSVYSMNYVLSEGQPRPPLDLIFWKVDLEEFIGRVTKEISN